MASRVEINEISRGLGSFKTHTDERPYICEIYF